MRTPLPLAFVILAVGCSRGAPAPAAPPPAPAIAVPAKAAPAPASPAAAEEADPRLRDEARRAADGSPLPPLACRFRVQSTKGGEEDSWDLTIWRGATRFETLESRHDTGEAWLRDPAGRISGLERLFHGPRKSIDYGEGDLRLLGSHRTWESVARVMDPSLLQGALLRKGDAPAFLGLASEWWEGSAEGFRMRVRWVPSLALPAEAERLRGDETLLLRLLEVHPPASAPWSPPSAEGYDRVEFADLGDRHGDSFFRQFQHGGGGEVRGDGYGDHGRR